MPFKYDLFISFKNSQEDGITKTIDSEIANKLFHTLREKKLNIFFSNKVLAENGIANYMLEIQNALESSKTLLVIYSETSYLTGGWVAHEWMTFLNLLMKDPDRKIFLYSITKDTTNIPPFLRPYECFIEYEQAIEHLTNSTKFTFQSLSAKISKRIFLSAYWGLFSDNSFDIYYNKQIAEPFNNHDTYCLKWKYINGLATETFTNELERLATQKPNPLTLYLLSMQYRDADNLDLIQSNSVRAKAYHLFIETINNVQYTNEEIALIIIANGDHQYNGAFYMCDVINDVLDAHEIKTKIYIINDTNSTVDFSKFKKSIIFIANACSYLNENITDAIQHSSDNILIGLNSFGRDAINYDFKNCIIFENTSKDITRICRLLLS